MRRQRAAHPRRPSPRVDGWATSSRGTAVRSQRGARTGGPWCSCTASAATRPCGGSSRPTSRSTTASSSSTRSGPAGPTSAPTTRRSTARCAGTPPTSWRSAASSSSRDVVLVGHSVSAMIGVLALPGGAGAVRGAGDGRAQPALRRTTATTSAASAAPTSRACSTRSTANHLGWSAQMAPVIMGNPDHPELAEELTNSFCRTDPDIAAPVRPRHVPVRQPRRPRRRRRPDPRPAVQRGRHRPRGRRPVRARGSRRAARSPSSRRPGTCPHLSAPEETTAAIRAFLSG